MVAPRIDTRYSAQLQYPCAAFASRGRRTRAIRSSGSFRAFGAFRAAARDGAKEQGMGIGLEETTPTKEPLRHVIARWVSAIIHPIAFPLLTLGVVTYIATASIAATSRWLLLAIVLT